MDPSLEVSQGAKIYLDYRIWSVPAIFYRDILIGYYIGSQQTKIAMGVSITVNIINILLDYIFIFYLGFRFPFFDFEFSFDFYLLDFDFDMYIYIFDFESYF